MHFQCKYSVLFIIPKICTESYLFHPLIYSKTKHFCILPVIHMSIIINPFMLNTKLINFFFHIFISIKSIFNIYNQKDQCYLFPYEKDEERRVVKVCKFRSN